MHPAPTNLTTHHLVTIVHPAQAHAHVHGSTALPPALPPEYNRKRAKHTAPERPTPHNDRHYCAARSMYKTWSAMLPTPIHLLISSLTPHVHVPTGGALSTDHGRSAAARLCNQGVGLLDRHLRQFLPTHGRTGHRVYGRIRRLQSDVVLECARDLAARCVAGRSQPYGDSADNVPCELKGRCGRQPESLLPGLDLGHAGQHLCHKHLPAGLATAQQVQLGRLDNGSGCRAALIQQQRGRMARLRPSGLQADRAAPVGRVPAHIWPYSCGP
eukprot:scaffold5696_cov119-Isochrysis_galbana.AAC.5